MFFRERAEELGRGPSWSTYDKTEQRKLAPRIAAMYEVFLKTKEPDHTGNLGGLRSLFNKAGNAQPTEQQRPAEFFKGGSVGTRYGMVSGALTAGYEDGDVDYFPGTGGNSMRLRNPSSEALDVIRKLNVGKNPLDD